MIEKPRWVRDLKRFLPVRSQFVLSGNVRDRYPVAVEGGPPLLLPLVEYLANEFAESGIESVVAFDPYRGFHIPPSLSRNIAADRQFFQSLGINFGEDGCARVSPERFFETLAQIVPTRQKPFAVIVDFAARMLQRPDHLLEAENRGFTQALILAHTVQPWPHPVTRTPIFNPVVWIAEKEGDLPDWFVVDNPRIRHVPIPKPDHRLRRAVSQYLVGTMPIGGDLDEPQKVSVINRFVEATEGLRLVDLEGVAEIMRAENIKAIQIDDAIRRYKLGVTEDPWRAIDRDKLANAESQIRKRVKGQDLAVRHMLDIVTRAATGIGGARGGRPRGVAFLAGPTGVGKTELAKAVTELLFGDERAYVRFDMSEFSAEHADQRLIGAPPGYVGYDTGGELTNAIRERPFSVVLFDEIEKAHPRILDKFLQILEDGVLTSGRGERVYFSESLIIFTSNLGLSVEDEEGRRRANISADEPYPEIVKRVRFEIDRHFKLKIGRPEILNRIGENVIVFDFIRSDLAKEIFTSMMAATLKDIEGNEKIRVDLSDAAMATLAEICLADLSNGGRGIRNQIEAAFVNPLARLVFEKGLHTGATLRILAVSKRPSGVVLEAQG